MRTSTSRRSHQSTATLLLASLCTTGLIGGWPAAATSAPAQPEPAADKIDSGLEQELHAETTADFLITLGQQADLSGHAPSPRASPPVA